MRMEDIQQFLFDIGKRIRQHRAGIHTLPLMDQERRDPQGTNRTIRFLVVMLEIIVHKPVDVGIDRHIHLRIVQRRNS